MRGRTRSWIALLTAGAIALHLLMLVFGHGNPMPEHDRMASAGHHDAVASEERGEEPSQAPHTSAEMLYACLAVLVLAAVLVPHRARRQHSGAAAVPLLRSGDVFSAPSQRARSSPVDAGVLLRV